MVRRPACKLATLIWQGTVTFLVGLPAGCRDSQCLWCAGWLAKLAWRRGLAGSGSHLRLQGLLRRCESASPGVDATGAPAGRRLRHRHPTSWRDHPLELHTGVRAGIPASGTCASPVLEVGAVGRMLAQIAAMTRLFSHLLPSGWRRCRCFVPRGDLPGQPYPLRDLDVPEIITATTLVESW